MSKKTLKTSDLIHSIKLRAAIPESQVSFTEADFLMFINEEVDLGVVPLVLAVHEDYFLFTEDIQLDPAQTRYEIPSRAIGNKLRDITYSNGGQLYEMTRISVEDLVDKFNIFDYSYLRDFYIEGSEIVIPQNLAKETGVLKVSYYSRPNTLVSESEVAIVTSIQQNKGLVTVDKVPEAFSVNTTFDVISSKSSFKLLAKEISPEQVADTENLTFTFGTQRILNVTLPILSLIPDSSYIQLTDIAEGTNDVYVFWFDKTGSSTAPSVAGASINRVNISSAVTQQDVINILLPIINSLFVNADIIASPNTSTSFLVQNGGVGISVGNNFSIVADDAVTVTVVSIGTNTIPPRLQKNDVIALPEESSIPQIPVELHSLLAQRSAMRCLESLGDMQGLQAAAAKLADMEKNMGMLIDNRVESSPIKIVPRHTTIKRNAYKKTNRGY